MENPFFRQRKPYTYFFFGAMLGTLFGANAAMLLVKFSAIGAVVTGFVGVCLILWGFTAMSDPRNR